MESNFFPSSESFGTSISSVCQPPFHSVRKISKKALKPSVSDALQAYKNMFEVKFLKNW